MTKIKIPNFTDAQLDIAKNWDKYIGSIWANVLVESNVPLDGTFVEVAPGTAEKVGRGLEAIGFKGKLYVIEPEENCLKIITQKYMAHIPGCSVIPVQKTLKEAIAYLPKKVDAILANHPLDDMILGEYLTQESFRDYFGETFGTSIERTKANWSKIESNKEKLEEVKNSIFQDWQKVISKTSPALVGISQYKSYYFTQNKVTAPDNNALDVLERIRKEYSENENVRIMTNIRTHNADLEHWLVLNFKC